MKIDKLISMMVQKHTKSKQGKRKRAKSKKKTTKVQIETPSYLQQHLEDSLNSVDAIELVDEKKQERKSRIEVKRGLKNLQNLPNSEDELEDATLRTSLDSNNQFEIESSILFEPFRAMGYITSSTPFYVHKNEEDRLMTVSIDHAFHVYDLEKLKLVYISKSIKQKITQIQTHKNLVYTLLSNNTIVKWRRMHIEQTFECFHAPIIQFLVVATYIIVLCEEGRLYVIDLESRNIKSIIELGMNAYYFMHPISYLNKIVVA
jgi:hypothetical protein